MTQQYYSTAIVVIPTIFGAGGKNLQLEQNFQTSFVFFTQIAFFTHIKVFFRKKYAKKSKQHRKRAVCL